MSEPFYWRHARDSLLTPLAIQLFQIIAQHEGKELDAVKEKIDEEYLGITGKSEDLRHGGKVQTAINVYREAGWVDLSPNEKGRSVIQITEAGRQALLVLAKLPDFLKAAPYFVVQLLSRYQLNNPARPSPRDAEYDAQLAETNVFPYWTLFKIMRSCENYITSEELRRFVFQLKNSEDIPNVISQIKKFRRDKESGMAEKQLNQKYPSVLGGAVSEPKYLMGRLGIQVGKTPSVVYKDGASTWRLEEAYLPFIDEILKNEPVFKEYVDERSWMQVYSRPIQLTDDSEEAFTGGEFEGVEIPDIPDDDSVWLRTKQLLDSGSLAVVLSGSPGTSKTWYAWRIAGKIVGGKARNVRRVQFHPSFSYDDFIEGYVPRPPHPGEADSTTFKLVPKVFLGMCGLARKSPDEKFVIVIDEMTRGDISRIFGELITYVEPSYRDERFTLAYSGRTISLPRNVILIGTMNPYDRSITELDDALDRRFERIELPPNLEILKKLLTDAGADGPFMGKVIAFFNTANKLAPHGFGHAYFVGVGTEEGLVRLWNHKLKFVFEKMFRFDADKCTEVRTAYVSMLTAPNLIQ